MKNFKKLAFLTLCSATFMTSCGMKNLSYTKMLTWVEDHYHFCTKKDVTKIQLNFSISTNETDKEKPKAKEYANKISNGVKRNADDSTSFSVSVALDSSIGINVKTTSEQIFHNAEDDAIDDLIYGNQSYTFTTCNGELSVATIGKTDIKYFKGIDTTEKEVTITDIYNTNGQRRYSKITGTWTEGDVKYTGKYAFLVEF